MSPLPFRLKIALLSAGISGVVLLASGWAAYIMISRQKTAALDTERGTQVMDLLRRITRERNAAVVTVTHDERMISGFDSVYCIRDGRLEPAGQTQGTAAGASAGGGPSAEPGRAQELSS